MLSCFIKAIRHLKNEAEWQEILAKVKEEEEEPLPSYLFKVKTKHLIDRYCSTYSRVKQCQG